MRKRNLFNHQAQQGIAAMSNINAPTSLEQPLRVRLATAAAQSATLDERIANIHVALGLSGGREQDAPLAGVDHCDLSALVNMLMGNINSAMNMVERIEAEVAIRPID